jgi:hypothetical protein
MAGVAQQRKGKNCITISFIYLHSSHNNCKVMKLRTRGAMHMTNMGERRNGFGVSVAKTE